LSYFPQRRGSRSNSAPYTIRSNPPPTHPEHQNALIFFLFPSAFYVFSFVYQLFAIVWFFRADAPCVMDRTLCCLLRTLVIVRPFTLPFPAIFAFEAKVVFHGLLPTAFFADIPHFFFAIEPRGSRHIMLRCRYPYLRCCFFLEHQNSFLPTFCRSPPSLFSFGFLFIVFAVPLHPSIAPDGPLCCFIPLSRFSLPFAPYRFLLFNAPHNMLDAFSSPDFMRGMRTPPLLLFSQTKHFPPSL